MKKFCSALLSLVMVFGLTGNVQASNFLLGLLSSPGSYSFDNHTDPQFVGDVATIPLAAGAVLDNHIFGVNTLSSLGAAVTSINATADASVFTSFSLSLSEFDGVVWNELATSAGTLIGSLWVSALNFAPIDALAAQSDAYRLTVSANKLEGAGGYGGNLTVTPIPEPEIYAMMAAGLGIMGWIGRRRKQQVV